MCEQPAATAREGSAEAKSQAREKAAPLAFERASGHARLAGRWANRAALDRFRNHGEEGRAPEMQGCGLSRPLGMG
jgi:hypothetical protein